MTIKLSSSLTCKLSHLCLFSNILLISLISRLSVGQVCVSFNSDFNRIITQSRGCRESIYTHWTVGAVHDNYLLWSRGHVCQSLLSSFYYRNPHGNKQKRKLLIMCMYICVSYRLFLVEWQIKQNRGWTTIMKKLNDQHERWSVEFSCKQRNVPLTFTFYTLPGHVKRWRCIINGTCSITLPSIVIWLWI